MPRSAAKVAQLRAQGIFGGVDDATLTSANVRFVTFAPGDVIAHHGDKHSPLVLLVSGRAQTVRYAEDGRECGIGFVRPGESSGAAAIVLGTPAMFSVVAVTTVNAGLMDRADARRLFDTGSVSKALLKQLACKLERVVDNQAALTLPSSYARIYAAILSALREHPGDIDLQPELPGQVAIALAANVSRETVSRALKTLLTRGAIIKEGRRYRLADRRVLQQLTTEA